jgi:phosphatidate cytidylyltransferase
VKQRSISAVGVVVVGLVPAIIGGPVWASVFAVLCLLGFHEYLQMVRKISPGVRPFGYLLIPAFAAASYAENGDRWVIGILAVGIGLPLVEAALRTNLDGAVMDWSLAAAGVFYLGLPLYSAIELRDMAGTVERAWISDLAENVAIEWDASERGLAWLISVILVTWLGDTFAYLVGRSLGRRKLSPVVSPNKTVEGFIGGLAAASLTGALSFWAFGLDDDVSLGLIFGAALAIIALFGDLGESVIKREAGVKDSGSMIPGHGGMLDRLDALLFTFVAGWFLALGFDQYVL